ncbi:MAG: SMP-30/gluconolactonase/LRE family protein [Pseudomonadota bacterium]
MPRPAPSEVSRPLRFIGTGLKRPECVVAHQSGLLFAPDWRGNGGISITTPQGTSHVIEAKGDLAPFRPNGIALEPGGTFLTANLGAEQGGLYRFHPDGALEPVLTTLNNRPVPPSNFVHLDAMGRIWLSVSTRKTPRSLGYNPDVRDGFVVLMDKGQARIVVDNLGYTNECVVSPFDGRLYINETFGRRTVAFDLDRVGNARRSSLVASFGTGTFPDGLTFDGDGGVWITSIVSNRVIRLGPNGAPDVILEDNDPDFLISVEHAYRNRRMGRRQLDTVRSRQLQNISNLAFGGPDMRTAYLGCLLGTEIAAMETDVAGYAFPHYTYPLGPLERYLSE